MGQETTAISFDELLSELERLQAEAEHGPDGFTTNQLCEFVGCGLTRGRRMIATLIAAGRVRHVGHASRFRIDGQRAKVPVYRVVSKGKSR